MPQLQTCAAAVLLLVQLHWAGGLNNGIVLPALGWSSWNHFGEANCTRNRCGKLGDAALRQIADAMVATGLKQAGYEYVNLDDGWAVGRHPNGTVIPDPGLFPEGIKATADYIHSLGMKMGLYTSRGQTTCLRRVGSQDYEALDMRQYASWGIDYVKVDSCGGDPAMSHDGVWEQYARYRDALNSTGRQVYLQLCNTLHYDDPFPELHPGGFAATIRPWCAQGRDPRQLANGLFIEYVNNVPSFGETDAGLPAKGRAPRSFRPNNVGMLPMVDAAQLLTYDNMTGPGSFSDIDMLEICNDESGHGRYPMSYDEYRAQLSIWSILASPLIMGNDPRNLTEECIEILTNTEILSLNQDANVARGRLVYQGTPGRPTATPVAMGGGLLWWPNASWVPATPAIGAGTPSQSARRPTSYETTDCIGCGDPPESLCWNKTRTHSDDPLRQPDGCNQPAGNSPGFVLQIWAKRLASGDMGVVAFNRGNTSIEANVTWAMLGLTEAQRAHVRDLWLHKDLGEHVGWISSPVASHAVWALRLTFSSIQRALHVQSMK